MIEGWNGFFEGQVTAAAALTGLVFVALSINLARIVAYPGLVGRAAEALMLLVLPVFVGLAALMPSQSVRTVGIEELCIVAIIAVLIARILTTSGWQAARERPNAEFIVRAVYVVAALVAGLAAALTLAAGSGDGFYVQAVSTALCLAGGIVDAWVLLVEILR